MTIETTLKALIAPLVAGGCHNVVNRSVTITMPYVVFRQISSVPENGLLGYAGITEHRYQIEVFAKSPEQAMGIALGAIKTAIVTSLLEGLLVFSSTGNYEEEDGSYQYITDYQIWAA